MEFIVQKIKPEIEIPFDDEKESLINDIQKIADSLKLEMQIVESFYHEDGHRIVIYFSALNELPYSVFGDLVKKLERKYRLRVELRQVPAKVKDLTVKQLKELITIYVHQALKDIKIANIDEDELDYQEYLYAKSFPSNPIPFEAAFQEIEESIK